MGLARTLDDANFKLMRLKTGKECNLQFLMSFILYFIRGYYWLLVAAGTPPRIDARTINTSCLFEQSGDEPPVPFSFLNEQQGIEVRGEAGWGLAKYITLCKDSLIQFSLLNGGCPSD